MSRVNLSGERVDEIVLNEKEVPGVDEVDGGIVPDWRLPSDPRNLSKERQIE